MFMIERGSNVNQADLYGRTPLHVAAAVDFPDMIKVLLENGGTYYAECHSIAPIFSLIVVEKHR